MNTWFQTARFGALVAAMMVSAAPACSEHPEQPAVQAALDESMRALSKSDFDALWALSDADTQRRVLDLAGALDAAVKWVPIVYADQTPEQHTGARRALGAELVGGIPLDDAGAGPALLARLLSPELLSFDAHALDGASHSDVTIDDDRTPIRAIVHTSAGEKVAFIKDGDAWKLTLIRDLLDASPSIRKLKDNAEAIEKLAAEQRAAWATSRDAKTPQGAYNLLRASLDKTSYNPAMVYTLLDQTAHARVLDALNAARDVQKEIQKRTQRKDRTAAYEAAGIALHAKATSDRELYTRWAKTKAFVPPLRATDDPPARVDGDVTGGRASVVTVAGKPYPFVRDASGVWHLSGHAAALDAALGAPVRKQLERYR